MNVGKDRRNIEKFITTCKSGSVDQAENNQSPASTTDSCDLFGKVKSLKSKIPVTITFINKTNEMRSVLWLDFKGAPQQFANLEPRQKTTIQTFVTHPWMFTDGPGNCEEIYQPSSGDTKFSISVTKTNIQGE